MKRLARRLKPKSGIATFIHVGLNVFLPIALFVLVRIDMVGVAVGLVLASKWRIFAVKPRHWPALIRTNAVDIIVGLSIVVFMTHTDSSSWQLAWTGLYIVWLLVLKPGSSRIWVAAQAMVGQFVGLMALYLLWGDASLTVLVLASWTVCYSAARHFFSAFNEPLAKLMSYTWAFFGAALNWILGHWLLFYGLVAQPTLLITSIGYALSVLYYLKEEDKLPSSFRRQMLFVLVAVIVVILVFSDWGDKTV